VAVDDTVKFNLLVTASGKYPGNWLLLVQIVISKLKVKAEFQQHSRWA
jgi:hypothetical protein